MVSFWSCIFHVFAYDGFIDTVTITPASSRFQDNPIIQSQ